MAGKDGTAGKTQPAEQALQANTAGRSGTAGGHSQRILRPAQASQQKATDDRPRSETTAADDLARLPCSYAGGSAKVLAAIKAGSDLPKLSLPHLSPLPVTVPTHSLNL